MRASRLARSLWSRHARDEVSNVPARLQDEWLGRGLMRQRDHPLGRLWLRASTFFASRGFECALQEDPVVSVEDNFDCLLIPADHVSRSPHDTYYVNRSHVLRTHTTAHQRHWMRNGPAAWVVGGDVYRRDEVGEEGSATFSLTRAD